MRNDNGTKLAPYNIIYFYYNIVLITTIFISLA